MPLYLVRNGIHYRAHCEHCRCPLYHLDGDPVRTRCESCDEHLPALILAVCQVPSCGSTVRTGRFCRSHRRHLAADPAWRFEVLGGDVAA